MVINLLPETLQRRLKIKRVNYIVTLTAIVVGVILLVLFLVLGGINLNRKRVLGNLESQQSDLTKKVGQFSGLEQRVLSFNERMGDIKTLVDQQPKWKNLFSAIEKFIPQEITLSTLKVTETSISVDGKGTDFNSIGRFLESARKFEYEKETGVVKDGKKETTKEKLFDSVVLSSFSVKEGKANFSATLNLRQGVLW